MSKNWVQDIALMHSKYGVKQWVADNPDKLEQLLHFRISFLKEEYEETFKAVGEKDPEEIVDGLIDLCVVAIGTLDAFGIDSEKAWDEVLKANMKKRSWSKRNKT